MNRYSTITFEIEAEFALNEARDIWVTFKQGKTVITKKKSEGDVQVGHNSCYVTLSQSESGKMNAYDLIALQVRWICGDASDSSSIEYFSLGEVLEEGEI